MRKKIDAHVHILPSHMLGRQDPRFRVTREGFGRVRTSSGYELQLLLPYFERSDFSAEALLATMDFYGVDKAVIMQALCFTMNEEVADAVAWAPDRLTGAMVIEPRPGWDEEMQLWHQRGLRVLKFEMSTGMGFSSPKAYPQMQFNDPLLLEMFALAQQLEITVAVDSSRIGGHGYQPEQLRQAAENFPELHFVICHLGYPAPDMNPEQLARWRRMTELAGLPNVWFDVSALPALFAKQPYPWKQAVNLMVDFVQRFGSQKVVWGTDIPGTLMNATYPQMVDLFENCGKWTQEEKENLFWKNAQDAYRLSRN